MAKFILSEKQYKRAIEEGVIPGQATTKTVVDGKGSPNVGAAVNDAAKNASTDTIEVVNFGKSNTSTSTKTDSLFEGRLITKQQLKEERMKRLRENSEIVFIKDIFKK